MIHYGNNIEYGMFSSYKQKFGFKNFNTLDQYLF